MEARRTILCLAMLLFSVPRAARADEFWKHRPASQWTRAEALKLLRRSPWAKEEVVVFPRLENQASFSVPTGTMHCDPEATDPNGNCWQKGRKEAPVDSQQQIHSTFHLPPSVSFLVRWESATPIAEAFARLKELGETAGAIFVAPPPRTPMDRYVVTVKVDQPGHAGFEPFLVTPAGKPELLAALKTSHGTVAPLEIEFTGTGANSAVHLFFPRTIDGAPLLGSERASAEFTLVGAGFSLRSKFSFDPGLLQ